MIARGVPGTIVNVSSQASQRALANHSVYCEWCLLYSDPPTLTLASLGPTMSSLTGSIKAALDMLTKMMALELGPHKVNKLGCPCHSADLPRAPCLSC